MSALLEITGSLRLQSGAADCVIKFQKNRWIADFPSLSAVLSARRQAEAFRVSAPLSPREIDPSKEKSPSKSSGLSYLPEQIFVTIRERPVGKASVTEKGLDISITPLAFFTKKF